MIEIPLTHGKFTIIDNEDYSFISKYKWYATKNGNIWYAANKGLNQPILYLHRIILDAKINEECDHINGNGLDNRRCNLRIVTKSQNQMNKGKQLEYKGISCSSKYKGVRKCKRYDNWEAYIKINNKQIFLGIFVNEEEAAKAYDVKAIELYGVYAKTNFGDG